MDKIFLRGLRTETTIGIWEWERRVTQVVSLDLEMATDARRASATDSIESALNYKDIAKRVIEFVGDSKFHLIETLAESVARIVVVDFDVPWVRVSASKPGAIEGSLDVGVVIERTSADYE